MKHTKVVIVLTLLIAGSMIATGATLSYLSNKAKASVKVDSPPVQLEYWDGAAWQTFDTTPLDLGTIYGTDHVQYSYKVTKLAHTEAGNSNPQITGTLWAKLYCAAGIGLADLVNVTVYVECPAISYSEYLYWSNDGDSGNDDFTPVDMGLWLKFEHPTVILYKQWGYKGYVKATFSQYAYGDYSIEMQIL